MEMKKLDKSVLKLWYIRAALEALALVLAFVGAVIVLITADAAENVRLAVLLVAGISVALLLAFVLVMPALRYKMYSWGYDEERIVVKEGVIFRKRVVIPVYQIQDLHRIQGPIMMMLKLSDVTVSTAGSNFDISTLTTEQADKMIDELERNLKARVEEHKNEEV